MVKPFLYFLTDSHEASEQFNFMCYNIGSSCDTCILLFFLQHGLELMSVIAIMVNSALIGMSDLAERLFPGWGRAERIIFIVALEVIF